jgi:hypothetical protein
VIRGIIRFHEEELARHMNRRQAMAVVGLPLLLAGCSDSRASFRYKLTLSVDTPEGVKSGFSVVQVDAQDVTIPARGTMTDARGEAVYVDLGKDARPIVAAMSNLRPRRGFRLSEGKPDIDGLLRLYGEAPKSEEELLDKIRRLARLRGPRMLTANDLPDLVTFADINEPKSVLMVDPHDLPAALERDVRWNRITIEVTNESVTTGIVKKLPWLKTGPEVTLDRRLDGQYVRYLDHRASLANTLSTADFRRGT